MTDTWNVATLLSAHNNSERLMHRVSGGSEITHNGISQLTESERRQLLEEWNATIVAFPRNVCVHELVEAQVTRTPDRVAVRFGQEILSYRELNEQANQLAHHLRSLGVEPGSLVGLCVHRGVRMLVGLVAILKAGGAYVPLAADHPKSRLARQVTDATALVTEADLVERFTEFSRPTVCIDTEDVQWRANPASNIERSTNSENLAYVIFTSGSTGAPKGVAVRHRNLVNYISFVRRWLELDEHPEGWRFATVSTLSADLGNTCIFPALASGGSVDVISEEIAVESARLASYCREYPIDVLKIVPSHLEALLAGSEGTGILPRKHLILGGEPLSKRLVQRIKTLGARCEISNHYGPTETTVGSVVLRLTGDYPDHNDPMQTVPIGRPIDNTQIYILDSQLQPAQVGVAGELCISGEGVAAGYLNQPELTKDRFIDNPFVPNSKMYRTGDLCRYMADGKVEFLGRVDDQIKIRGFRVELGEIEATLAKHPSVKQAVVVAKDAQGDKRLIGYVVGPSPTEDLRAYLKEQLPEYMVPAIIISLPRLPLNSNGKVDRRSLIEPEKFQTKSTAYVAPRTSAETKIAEIWSEVLGNERIGLGEDFFEIGGHSLAGIQVMSRILNYFHVRLEVGTLFDFPTIEGLAQAVERAGESGAGATAEEEIRPAPREQYLWR